MTIQEYQHFFLDTPQMCVQELGPNSPYLGKGNYRENKRIIGTNVINADALLKRVRSVGWLMK